jgi:predicted lipoprotein
MRKLELIAQDVLKAWQEWCETEGWDNQAYDDLSDNLSELEMYFESEKRAVKAVAPCTHNIEDSKCVGGPNDQNRWRCNVCGKEWLR